MSLDIPESDWKIFRQLRTVALERFCERAVSKMAYLASEKGQTHHEHYLTVYRKLRDRNDELADAFNNPRRSAAVIQLARICAMKLLTEDELARFGDQTRKILESFAEFQRQRSETNE